MIKVRFILWPKTRHWWTESRWFPRVRQRRCCRIRALIMTMTQMSCCQLLVCVMFQSMSVHHTKTVGLQRFEVVFFWTSYRIQSSKVYIIDIGHRRGKKSGFPKKKSMKYQCWSGGEHQPSGILLMMVSCLCQLETTCNHSRSSYLRLWWPSIAMETPHSSMIFPAINPIQINFDRILQWQLQLPAQLSAVWSNEAPVPPPPPGPVAPVVPERWVHGRNGGPPKG